MAGSTFFSQIVLGSKAGSGNWWQAEQYTCAKLFPSKTAVSLESGKNFAKSFASTTNGTDCCLEVQLMLNQATKHHKQKNRIYFKKSSCRLRPEKSFIVIVAILGCQVNLRADWDRYVWP